MEGEDRVLGVVGLGAWCGLKPVSLVGGNLIGGGIARPGLCSGGS